jgi:hypothetical protein
MSVFAAKRVSYEYTQTNDALPDKVFPLLCPVREAEWIPGWQCRLIYSQSGVAEDGCVFTTPNEDGADTVWMVTHHDPAAFKIAYAWIKPGMIATQLRISLLPGPPGKTATQIHYFYTGLSAAGNKELENYTPEWFRSKMQGWENAINHYLATGQLLRVAKGH